VLTPGTTAPPFTLSDQDDNEVSLKDLAGKWVVLWWYPKAATPG
jgi:peroxiredoxin Q/BCP